MRYQTELSGTSTVLMDVKELSTYLNMKPKTIYSMIAEIPCYRIGRLLRFRKDEVDSWLKSCQNRLGKPV